MEDVFRSGFQERECVCVCVYRMDCLSRQRERERNGENLERHVYVCKWKDVEDVFRVGVHVCVRFKIDDDEWMSEWGK